MCGAEIPKGVYVCPNCKNEISEGNIEADASIGGSNWGEIHINLGTEKKSADLILRVVKRVWQHMEIGSAQRLFLGQSSRFGGSKAILKLCGPFETYDRLVNELTDEGVEQKIVQFFPITLAEMYKLRDAFERNENYPEC
jgi:hypothetical protein